MKIVKKLLENALATSKAACKSVEESAEEETEIYKAMGEIRCDIGEALRILVKNEWAWGLEGKHKTHPLSVLDALR